ncbi:DUF2059 domain-containing protein [Parasphingorhabdus sp.]|uniref:DUF2059 domain-containing protein n=1 Tax=Parasphingorhabdus sp. TaxID=2709688 RepID=UPI003001E69F
MPASAEAASPERLAAARVTVDYLFPLGTYQRMMKGTMDQLMDSILSQTFERPMAETMKGYGLEDKTLDGLGEASFKDLLTKRDPHFEERMKISTRVMMDEMVDLMTTMEPALREALTKIYARKYTVPQLGEMNRFFATETGSAFARDYMMVFVDPEMMQSMMGMVPAMMDAMPEIVGKVEAATAHLPAPAQPPAEELEDTLPDGTEAASGDDGDAASAPENWSDEDRERVERLGSASDESLQQYYEAIEAAESNARARRQKDQ